MRSGLLSVRSWARVGLLPALLLTTAADAAPNRRAERAERPRLNEVEELAPWAAEPDQVKLDIVQRLVLEKQQYATALPLIAAMRKEGLRNPILDLVQGVALREEGLQQEAESLLLEARRRMPGDARVHDALCVLYADLQQLDLAIESCHRATRLDEDRASAWNNLGYLYLVSGKYPESMEASKRASELDSGDVRYRNNLALAHVAVGDTRRALDLFLSTGPKAEAHFNLGAAVERFVGPDDALPWYREALAADPTFAPALEAVTRLAPLPTTPGAPAAGTNGTLPGSQENAP